MKTGFRTKRFELGKLEKAKSLECLTRSLSFPVFDFVDPRTVCKDDLMMNTSVAAPVLKWGAHGGTPLQVHFNAALKSNFPLPSW
jgi:hypothetical protein